MACDVERAQRITDTGIDGADASFPAFTLLWLAVEHMAPELKIGLVKGLRQDVCIGVQAMKGQVRLPGPQRRVQEQLPEPGDCRVLGDDEPVERARPPRLVKRGPQRIS